MMHFPLISDFLPISEHPIKNYPSDLFKEKFTLSTTISNLSNFSSVRRSPTMRPQQDFSRFFCSCCCPPLLSCSFLVPLGLLSHCYPLPWLSSSASCSLHLSV